MRWSAFFLSLTLLFSGCSWIILHSKKCALNPSKALETFFGVLDDRSEVKADLGPITPEAYQLDIKKIMQVAPDPLRVLSSLGEGNAERGWEEIRFLRTLTLFYASSGLEFQEYILKVVTARPLPQGADQYNLFLVTVERIDMLLDMRDDNNVVEVRMRYNRKFVASFTSHNCIEGLTPVNEWQEVK